MSKFIKSLKLNKLIENKNSRTVISLLLGLYATVAAPALPNSIISFFDSVPGRLLFIFLIAYIASKDVQVSIMLALAFVVTLIVANNRKEQFRVERFTDNEQTCSEYCVDRRITWTDNFKAKYDIDKEDDEDEESYKAKYQAKYDGLKAKKEAYVLANKAIKDVKKDDLEIEDLAEIANNNVKIANKKYAINVLKKFAKARGITINTSSDEDEVESL